MRGAYYLSPTHFTISMFYVMMCLGKVVTMKKLLISVFLIMACFMWPIFGATQSQPAIKLQLNHLRYVPTYQPTLQKDLLYLSIDDLCAMTYSHYTQDDQVVTLNFRSDQLIFNKQDLSCKKNGIHLQLSDKPYLNDNGVLYLPLTLLDKLKYPYTYDASSTTLSLEPLVPYSPATDTYDSHTYYKTTAHTLNEVLQDTLTKDEIATLIDDCKVSNSYFSFINVKDKKACLDFMKQQFHVRQYQYDVYFRELRLTEDLPALGGFTHMPLSYNIVDDGINVTLGTTTTLMNCFWATYNPSLNSPHIDTNKSLDVMLMRSIYESYRGTYGLKDDQNISPILKVVRDRSDYMHFEVYLHDTEQKPLFTVVIYKKATSQHISYYVDFIAHT